MRKWLVGLLAAGLCASSAWAATDTLTREFTGVEAKATYVEWSGKTGESGAVYAGQSAGDKDSIQLRSNNNNSGIVTTGSGGTATKVTVAWNENTSADREVSVYGKADAYSAATDLYSKDAQGTLIGSIKKGESTELSLGDGYEFIGLRSKSGALYLDSVEIEWGGEASLSVTLDKANGFTVALGTSDSITATAKNGVEPYEYAWTSDTTELNGEGETLTIPATLAAGDYTVQVEVTDAEQNKASKQIGFTVAAPADKYQITVAEGIVNGEVTVDKTEAEAGETVKVTATPAEGYGLEAITVNGNAITGTSFEMPAQAVEVGATFVEVKDYAELPFVAEETPYSGPWKGAAVSGLSNNGLGSDYADGSAKFDTTGDWMQVKFTGTPGTLSFGIKGNSLKSEQPSTFLVQESATGEEGAWTTIGTYVTDDGLTGTKADVSIELSATSQFVRFFYETKGAGNVGIYDVYISSGGPATFSIKLDPASYFEVEVGEEASIAATPKNPEGDVHYAWTVGGEPAGSDSAVLGLDTTAATEVIEVVCTATDGANSVATASVSYKVVAPAPKFQVGIAIGIPNGSVSANKTEAEAGEEVTLTAYPAVGYKLVTFLVDGEAITGDTFKMPGHDVLVSAEFEESTGVVYTLVETADEFEEGADYLVVSHVKDKFTSALKNEANGSRIALQEVALNTDGKTIETDLDTVVWQIKAGAETGQYVLYNEAASVYAAAPKSAGNNAQLVTNESDPLAQWTLDFSSLPAVKIFSVSYTDRYLQRNSSTGTLYFAAYASAQATPSLYKKAGPATFTVTLDKADGFTVELGKSDSITATAKNGSGDYSYAWTGDLTGDAATLEIPATLAAGTYTVKVTATDNGADAQTAEKSISFTVAAPAQKYPITVAEGIENGTVTVDKTEAEAGETVKVTATPATGYGLEAITVNGSAISGTSFEMPAQAVEVAATFVEVKDYAELPFVAEDTPYSGPWKGATVDGMTSKGLGDDYKDGSAKLDGKGDYIQIKFVGTPGTLSYGIKGNSVSADNPSTFLVQESADGENWDTLETYVSGDNLGDKVEASHELSASSQFVRFFYDTKGAGNVGIYDVYISSGGPATPKIVFDGETTIELGEGNKFDLNFRLENYDGTFEWVVDSREGGSIDQDGHYEWEPTEPGEVTIKIVARDGELDIASKEVPLTVTEPGPQPGEPAVQIAGPDTGAVDEEVSCQVWAINMENPVVFFEGEYEVPDGSSLTGEDFSNGFDGSVCTFTPDVAGVYWIEFTAYESDDLDTPVCSDRWTITVSDEPGPQPTVFQITGLTKTGDNLVLTFAPEGTPAVLGTDSLSSPQEWTPVEGAAVSGTTATVPMGDQRYITLK